MKKKIIAIALCAALAVGGAVAGSLAFFTDTDAVTNTFSVGDIDIELDEAPVDADGKETTGNRVTENSYKLLPGHKYDKDPTVHIMPNSVDCYVFVRVDNQLTENHSDHDVHTAECGETCAYHKNACSTIAEQIAANGWLPVADTDNVYYYAAAKGANENKALNDKGAIATSTAQVDLVVFENFWINENLLAQNGDDEKTGPEYLSHWDGKKVIVTAYAVQAEGFTTAKDAWDVAGSKIDTPTPTPDTEDPDDLFGNTDYIPV